MFTYDPGYTSTASCQSAITYIDGEKGKLLHRGYAIEDLANNSDYPEVCYLLLNGELPDENQKEKFTIKKWSAVTMWKWEGEQDQCSICRQHLMEVCIECQAN